ERSPRCRRPCRRSRTQADCRAAHDRPPAGHALSRVPRPWCGDSGRHPRPVRSGEGLHSRRPHLARPPRRSQGRGARPARAGNVTGRCAGRLRRRGQGDRRPRVGQAGLRTDHRCRGRASRRRGAGHHPERLRRQLPHTVGRHLGHADHHRQAQLGHPRARGGSRHPDAVPGTDLRCRHHGTCRRAQAEGAHRPAGAHRSGDRGLRWARNRWRLLAGRGLRRQPGGRGRCLACCGGLRLVPALVPGRPDRQDGLPAALHRQRHLRRDPAPGGDADVEDHRRGQQGRGGADLRARRLRCRGGLEAGAAAGDRGDREAQGV
ncbi:MAG: Electron transfer flavoprotein, alpha subunit, partial [uncultured Nocardioidaceae bacterium]